MLKIYKDTTVFVHIPYKVVTGGAELLFQLVDNINNNGGNAYVVYSYYGDDFGKEIPSDYQKYNIKIADEVIDNSHNIEVFNESESVKDISKYPKIQKILWWLSVNNFYSGTFYYLSNLDILRGIYEDNNLKILAKKYYFRLRRISTKFPSTLTINKLKKMNVVHGFQSEYAQNWLENHGFKEVVALKDYINTDHFAPFSKNGREDIVLYNPVKGKKFTQKLIRMAPEINWLPLQNMTRSQVIETMRKAKVYIDFGNHPGKDRLPRECASNGCCVITGMRGGCTSF